MKHYFVRGCGLCILLSVLGASCLVAESWTKNSSQSEGCQQPGFSSVSQKDNEPIIGENVHSLSCTGCGNLACEWSSHPVYGNSPNDIGDVVDSRVAAGLNSGSEVTTINGVSWYYSWLFTPATGVLNLQIWL